MHSRLLQHQPNNPPNYVSSEATKMHLAFRNASYAALLTPLHRRLLLQNQVRDGNVRTATLSPRLQRTSVDPVEKLIKA